MEYKAYLDQIEKKLSPYFNIQKDYPYKDMEFDLFAQYFLRNERYMISKKITIYGVENNEYCFIKRFPELDEYKLQQYLNHLEMAVEDFVKPHEEHMSSMITGVILLPKKCNEALIDKIKKFKFHKNFALGFKGWADIRLIIVFLDEGEVISNKKGKEVANIYKLF
jgi:hypothetical protein